jgi:multidrug efflux pump subunit AcrB
MSCRLVSASTSAADPRTAGGERRDHRRAADGGHLIYLILASQFGSFFLPVAIMVSLPLSVVGVMLALLVTHTTLNIFSMIGIVFLMGLVTKNAILLVDFANRGQRDGLERHAALLAAGQVRLRPILMTTAAMIFGMLPLAIGLGEGAEQQAPMGRAIIGGVITSTLLTLVVVPVIYTYIDAFERRVAGVTAPPCLPSACRQGLSDPVAVLVSTR